MIAPSTKPSNVRLTKRAVDAAVPRSERYILWDVELKGFGLRVEPSGTKTFLVRYRPKGVGRSGAKRFMKVGRYGSVTPDEARNHARAILGAVAGGDDPAGEQIKAREAITFAELAERYLNEEVRPKRKPGTATLYSHYLQDLAAPEIGDVSKQTPSHARTFRDSIRRSDERAPLRPTGSSPLCRRCSATARNNRFCRKGSIPPAALKSSARPRGSAF